MITQYLNINVIELFNADSIAWSHRSSAAFKLLSNTVDSIILKWETLQDSSQSRPNWEIGVVVRDVTANPGTELQRSCMQMGAFVPQYYLNH